MFLHFLDEALGSKRENTVLEAWKKGVLRDTGNKAGDTSKAKRFVMARDLAMLVSEDLLPFSLVEGSGFKKFLVRSGVVRSESEIPVRTTISRGALDDAYETVKEIVCRQLPRKYRYHVSTDIWTDRHRQLPFIAVVIHFLDEKFQLGFIPLKTDYFASPHTGVAIFEEIKKTLRDFNLDEALLFAAVSDAASNMVRGSNQTEHRDDFGVR